MYRMRKEKTNWKMQNVNPQGKDCDDCVFRAIAGGTGISWKDTFAGLCQTGLSLHAMPDYPIVFRKYLKEIGARYVYKSAQAHAHTEDEASTADMTAGEFIRQHPKGNYVLRLWWHVTCARDGFLYDTWDASSEKLLEAWEIPPDIASAPCPSAPWLYERSERRLAPLEDIDVAAGQTFLFRNPSPVNRGYQDSFVRAIALAEGRTWEEAYQDICRQALSQCDNPQSTSVAASYLSRYAVGTCQYFTRGKTPVKEFLASHPSGAWVLQLGKGWASAVVDGVLMDTRNYINKPIEVAWRLR